ncbi:MAG: magnesium chelatase domain-containing protein, partial [Deltaproteobacteria bacterium]
MLARIFTTSIIGVDANVVEVEVDLSRGLPYFSTVGLPDNAVKESRERVRSAIKNSGYEFPDGKITVNLAPADLKKEGTSFDLPVAIGLLKTMGVIKSKDLTGFLILGALSLAGGVRAGRGALSSAGLA